MKIRNITLLFALFTILMVIPGLYFYYVSIKTAALNEDRIVSQAHFESINNSITQLISRYSRISITLSNHDEISAALLAPSAEHLDRVNRMLDLFNSNMETGVCYLLNMDGTAIASSNRDSDESFVGKNYSFRPYFTYSQKGVPHVYMAYGVTSGKRGIYFSTPVFELNSGRVLGVCVIKEDVDKIEKNFISSHYPVHDKHRDTVLIVNKDAVIFMSDNKELLFKTFWPADEVQIKHIAASRQFGKGPWPWAGFKKVSDTKVTDASGRLYHFFSRSIQAIPHWQIIHLSDADAISNSLNTSFRKTAGYLSVFALFVIIVFYLALNYLAGRAGKELKLSEEKYRSVTDTVNEGIVLQASSGEILTWNRGAEKIFGIPAEAVLGKRSEGEEWSTIHEDGSPYEGKDHPSIRTLTTGKPNTNEIMGVYRPSGELRWISINTNPIFEKTETNPYAVAISFSDITELKKEKEALRNERDLIEQIMETSPAAITRVDAGGRVIYINRRAEEILGFKPSRRPERTYDDPEWKITDFFGNPFPQENLPFNRVKKTGQAVYDVQHAIEWPDGKQVFLSINASPIFNLSGDFEGMVATIEDISEKYKAEQNYQMIFREMFDGFALHEIICDDSGKPVDYRFLAVNPAFERLTGLSAKDIIGKTVLEVLPGTEPSWIENFGKVALTGEPSSFEDYTKELDRYYQVTAFRPAKNQFACIITDTTERKSMEKRLLQAQKMESIGSLAGGIAHDFNNILFPIIGMAELMMEDLPKDSVEYGNVEEILKAGKRGGDLVKQILAFSRQTEYQTMPIRVQQVLKEVLKLCRSTIPADIEISNTIQHDCGMVLANATQIHQVAMNLITNAYHAIEPDPGKIDVRLKEMNMGWDQVSGTHLSPGGYAKLSISDNGGGIPPDILDKIFDPYFTTKEKGKGTGLGLAIVYGIVREYKGDIKVVSNLGEGTAFHVFLPLMKESSPAKTDHASDDIKTGTERILLVDDEAPIVQLQKALLERLGYKTTERTSSTDALKAFEANPDNFDLVITDMTMPNMTGDRLAKEILSIRPDIPIIICTGYSERISEETAKTIGVKGFLMKPVVRTELARVIRSVLDEPGA